ncbi:MAG: hypothetical protein WC474_10200 [Hydrogenophilaceae bacterium]
MVAKLVVAVFALTLFIAGCVAILVLMGPFGMLSILYLLVTVPFAYMVINLVRGKTKLVDLPGRRTTMGRLFILLGLSFCALAGLLAFIGYWLTGSHYAAVKILKFFFFLGVLFMIFSGLRFDAR